VTIATVLSGSSSAMHSTVAVAMSPTAGVHKLASTLQRGPDDHCPPALLNQLVDDVDDLGGETEDACRVRLRGHGVDDDRSRTQVANLGELHDRASAGSSSAGTPSRSTTTVRSREPTARQPARASRASPGRPCRPARWQRLRSPRPPAWGPASVVRRGRSRRHQRAARRAARRRGAHLAPGSVMSPPRRRSGSSARRGHGRASRTMNVGVSAARRNRVKPASCITSCSLASPAWAPSASSAPWASALGVHTKVDIE